MALMNARLQVLRLIAEQEVALGDLFNDLVARMAPVIYAAAGADSTVPLDKQESVKQQLLVILFQLFLTSNMLALYSNNGTVYSMSPFGDLIWSGIRQGTHISAEQQAEIMRRAFVRHPDLLTRARDASRPLEEGVTRFATPYTLVRSSGRTLNDSIGFVAMETRRKLGLLLDELFAARSPVSAIVATLKRFFTPGQKVDRRGMGGRDGSADALAMARAEPLLAYSLASRTGAQVNPVIREIYVLRSHSGAAPCPVCDPMVDGSPYPAESAPLPGFHKHCLCRYRFALRTVTDAVTLARTTTMLDVINPLSRYYEASLLGSYRRARS